MKNFYFLNRRAISAPVFLKKAILLCIGLFILNTLFANETQDTIAPDIMLTDVLGNEITTIDTLFLPEGDCFYQLSFMLLAIDDCDGVITSSDAVWAEVEMMPLEISPVTQVFISNNGLGFYRVDAKFSIGTTNLTLYAEDTAGNISSKTYVVVVENPLIPEVTISIYGEGNVIIVSPCTDTRNIIVSIFVNDLCDENLDNGNIEFTANGTETLLFENYYYAEYLVTLSIADNASIWTARYIDLNGQLRGFMNKTITIIESAVQNPPPIFTAMDREESMPYCQDDLFFCYDFQICGLCEPIDANEVNFDSDGAGLAITYHDINQETNCGFFEACGDIESGFYVFNIGYNGYFAQPFVIVEQTSNQPAVIENLSEVNYTIPTCESSLTTFLTLKVSDDCDEINPDNLEVSLGEISLSPNSIEGNHFSYILELTEENNGDLLIYSYLDTDGALTQEDQLVLVNSPADNWEPTIIYPSQNINTEVFLCDDILQEVCFDIIAVDNCDGILTPTIIVNEVAIDVAQANTEGNTYCLPLPQGIYNVIVQATDTEGNVSNEDFIIVVTEIDVPDIELVCLNTTVVLSGACPTVLSALDVLTGEWGCLTVDDFEISVNDSDPSNGAIIDEAGVFNYAIEINPDIDTGGFFACAGEVVVEVGAPTIACPAEPLIFSTGPFDCSAAFIMPFPIITDSCAAYELFFDIYREVKVPTQDFGGYNLDTVSVYSGYPGEYVSNVWTQTVFIRYHAVANGDTTSIDCPIIIQDDVNPIAVCNDDVNIAIGANGTIRLYAEDVSEISHDFCSDVRIEIRREGGEWGEYIDFDCEDVQTNVIIELRVWDDANRNEIWGDWYGNDFHDADIPWDDSNDNVNICEVEVGVEDEISPTCIAPLDTSTICDNPLFPNIDWNNFDQLNEIFGEATADDNCSATSEQISVNINLNDCGWGTVVRIFSAVDDWGTESVNLCNQLISIAEIHDSEIKFPKDVDIQCGEAILDTLVYNTLGCDLFTVNVTNEHNPIFQIGLCYKALRTYKVINWCEWDGESDPVVISRNEDCDDDDGDEDIWVIVRTTENGGNLSYTTFLDRDNEETNFNPYIGHNRCGTGQGAALNGHWSNSNNNPELASVGFWQYTQIIKVSDDEVPTLEVADYGLFCVQSGDSTASVAITFTVTENWNLDMMHLSSRIDLGADGENDGTATLIEDEAAATSTSRTFSISGAYPIGVHNFELSATDNCHNTVNLDIPFEIMTCGPFDVNIIGGTIQTEESEGIEAVEVTLGGSGMQNGLTGNDGYYEFAETGDGLGAEYSITPYLNVQAPGSISSYDLILVTKHILGIQLLDSPYKIIAADVNNSGTVSSMDLMVLRELILGIYDEFPDNTFWRFVDANYVFPDPTNPWLEIFPEVKDITTVIYTELNHDFIGVAIGDVNNSAIPNFEATGDNRNRGDLFTLTTQNVRVKAGLNYKIDFTTTDLAKIEGYQFTLLFDKEILRFESIEYGISKAENFGLNYISEGMITTSWDKYNGISNQENSLDEVLFSIHFYANADGSLSDMLSLSSRITKAEAYDNDGILDVAINFVSENISKTDFEVYQNIPNPFSGETRINFNLPEDANVNIMIQDMRGRLVKLIKKSGVRGFNSVMFDANTLGVAGVFYYTVSTEEYVGTKRMVIVE